MAFLERSDQRTTQTASSVDSSTKAFPRDCVSGNLLVVAGAWWKAAGTTLAVTDTLSTTYTVVLTGTVSWASGVGTGFIAVGIASSSGANTVTVNPGGAASGNFITYGLAEFTGAPSDLTGMTTGSTNSGTSTTPSCSVTPSTSNELVIATMAYATSGTATTSAPNVELEENESGSFQPHNSSIHLDPKGTGSLTSNWTLGTSRAWNAVSVSIPTGRTNEVQEIRSHRATVDANNVNSTTVAYAANVTSGNMLMVSGCWWKSTSETIAVTDSQSNTYTVQIGTGQNWSAGFSKVFIAYATAGSSAACTITLDPGGAASGNWITAVAQEFSSTNGVQVDADGGETTGTSTTPSDGVTTSENDVYVLGANTWDNNGGTAASNVASSPACQLHKDVTSDSPVGIAHDYKDTTGTYTFTWTLPSSEIWSAITVALRDGAGGGGGGGGQAPRTMQQHRLRRVC